MSYSDSPKQQRRCKRCVMDTTDPDISFDASGVCNHCREYDSLVRKHVHTGDGAVQRLTLIVERIAAAGKGRPYDCIVGVSGGVDSTFVAYKVKELGLRALAVHMDNGWDAEVAVRNIEVAVRHLKIDLLTHVLNWEEFRDLQVAFLRSSTPDSEIPSDHAIAGVLSRTADKMKVTFIITGFNQRTESHLPSAWSQGHFDWRYIRSVHKQFGTRSLRTFPHLGYWKARRYLHSDIRFDLLNYLDYRKTDAIPVLERELGWKNYGGKHRESIYTGFYQRYLLPRKFGFDKRKTHLSSLICSGEITRTEALSELARDPSDEKADRADLEYVVKKLGLTQDEFAAIMRAPRRSFSDFPSYASLTQHPLYRKARQVYRIFAPASAPELVRPLAGGTERASDLEWEAARPT